MRFMRMLPPAWRRHHGLGIQVATMRLPVTLGIISDTHGMVDPQALAAFRSAGVDHILHAGDIVGRKGETVSSLMALLEQVAPVTAVRGNTDDKHDSKHGLPLIATYEAASLRCFVHHGDKVDHGDDEQVLERAAEFRVCVFPACE